MDDGQFSKEKESTHTLDGCYSAEVDIMKMVDCALAVVGILKNVSRTSCEDPYTDCNDCDNSRPEKGHEGGATAFLEHTN